jgi:AraC family transcriptional activator of pobA
MPGQIEHLRPSGAIPNFALYGEARDAAPFPDVLHCESIPARAALHDWTIAPHRHHNLHQFFWITAQGGTASLEGRGHRLAPAAALSLPPLSVHGFDFMPDTGGWVVTLPLATLERQLAEAPDLKAALGGGTLFHPTESPAWIFEAVAREYAGTAAGRAQALASLAGLLATWFARALLQQAGAAAGPRSGADLLARFQEAVERDYQIPRPLAGYAKDLGVTPTHLTRVARSLTGRPASQLILERRLLEARRALAYTSMQVAEVAYMLGYTDPAYFARVFAKATGESPSAFRARMTRL